MPGVLRPVATKSGRPGARQVYGIGIVLVTIALVAQTKRRGVFAAYMGMPTESKMNMGVGVVPVLLVGRERTMQMRGGRQLTDVEPQQDETCYTASEHTSTVSSIYATGRQGTI
jgi:hypothetical protein